MPTVGVYLGGSAGSTDDGGTRMTTAETVAQYYDGWQNRHGA
ncbi:MAG TPA: hypothetical protein VMA96_10020 [Solirubrobacteraceae bacterium]|nr:hypothetical protein [Solirubrobacteraceae bacterium]